MKLLNKDFFKKIRGFLLLLSFSGLMSSSINVFAQDVKSEVKSEADKKADAKDEAQKSMDAAQKSVDSAQKAVNDLAISHGEQKNVVLTIKEKYDPEKAKFDELSSQLQRAKDKLAAEQKVLENATAKAKSIASQQAN